MSGSRVRRSAEEARRVILEAAERRLSEAGPAALRLQDIARDVGISQPAILHHFGSREELMRALIEHATTRLELDLMRMFGPGDEGVPDGPAIMERVWDMLSRRGQARLMAWMALSGYEPTSEIMKVGFTTMAQFTHARLEATAGRKPTYEETLFAILVSTLALFGQAILGPMLFRIAGLDNDPTAPERLRSWLGSVLMSRVAGERV
jgi:AcrR family transcriptional regulator